MQTQVRQRSKGLANIVLLLLGSVYLVFQGNALAWLLAGLFAGVFVDQVMTYLDRAEAKSAGTLSLAIALAVTGARLFYWYATHGEPRWVLALFFFIAAFPVRTRLMRWMGIDKDSKAHPVRFTVLHWGLSALYFSLVLFLQPSTPVLQALLILFAAQFFYQGAVTIMPREDESEVTRSGMALGVTIGLLVVISSYGEIPLYPLFHVLVAIIVPDVIAIAFDATLKPETPLLHLSQDRLLVEGKTQGGFIQTIQQSYPSMISNVQALGVAAVVAFDLPERMVRSSMQGNVFEASLSLVGLLIAVVLFLKERGGHASSQFTLNGLRSLIIMFLVISGAAFVTLAITSGGAMLDVLPNLNEVTIFDLFTHKESGFGAIILFLYEGLFYTVLMGLVFIAGVIRDVLKHDDGAKGDEGKLVLPGHE